MPNGEKVLTPFRFGRVGTAQHQGTNGDGLLIASLVRA